MVPRHMPNISKELLFVSFQAYTAYLKNMALYSSKKIFNVKTLPIEEFAKYDIC